MIVTILTNATMQRRGRVASPEEDDGGDVPPTQQAGENEVQMVDGDGEDPQTDEERDRDGVGSEDEDAPTRKRTRLSEEGTRADIEPKSEPNPHVQSRVTLPRDPSDG
jgi:hypothetical protein